MPASLRITVALHWLALVVWIGALISAAVAAINVFGTLKPMAMSLADYPDYPPAEHGMLAAGRVMAGIFFLVDLLQFAAIPVALLTLLAQIVLFRMPWRRPSNLLRTSCLVLAAALFAFHATRLAPPMNHELRAYWAAAESGDTPAAESHRAEFNRLHPVASVVLQGNLVILLVAVTATAVALGPASPHPRLERPRLAPAP